VIQILSPERALHTSPGQRPGLNINIAKALKGRNIMQKKFWIDKELNEMNIYEWELLCDGCAFCCLHKIEDEKTGFIYTTNIACKMLNLKKCICKKYKTRTIAQPKCLYITPDNIKELLKCLPATCAYKILSEKRELPFWHHLISKSKATIHRYNLSVLGKVVSENEIPIDKWEEYIVTWENYFYITP